MHKPKASLCRLFSAKRVESRQIRFELCSTGEYKKTVPRRFSCLGAPWKCAWEALRLSMCRADGCVCVAQATVLYSMCGRQVIQGLCGALDTKASQVTCGAPPDPELVERKVGRSRSYLKEQRDDSCTPGLIEGQVSRLGAPPVKVGQLLACVGSSCGVNHRSSEQLLDTLHMQRFFMHAWPGREPGALHADPARPILAAAQPSRALVGSDGTVKHNISIPSLDRACTDGVQPVGRCPPPASGRAGLIVKSAYSVWGCPRLCLLAEGVGRWQLGRAGCHAPGHVSGQQDRLPDRPNCRARRAACTDGICPPVGRRTARATWPRWGPSSRRRACFWPRTACR